MNTMETFNTGLVITGLGMGLVFLTLVVVMYSIKLLDALFKVKPEAAEVAMAPALAEVEARAADLAVEAAPGDADMGAAEAAAIGVALALARRAAAVFAPSGATAAYGAAAYGPRPAPLWMKPLPAGDDEPQGEVVMVVDVDPGPGTWKAQGRQDGLQ